MKSTLILDQIYVLEEIDTLIQSFGGKTDKDRFFLFSGPMGAGKTALIRHWGKALGLQDPVQSPSYNLIHEYRPGNFSGAKSLTHMDWFRIETEEEAIEAGIEEAMSQAEGLVFIEWPERLPHWAPNPHIWIELEILDPSRRRIRAERRENRSKSLA